VWTTLQLTFFYADFFLHAYDCIKMELCSVVRSAGEGEFALGVVVVLHTACFYKGQDLKWFGRRAQKGDRVRVAIRV
jgi:hypothetical protein